MLLTVVDLVVWCKPLGVTVDPADEFALEIVLAASDKVRSAASQPTWDIATAPTRARQIASHLAARSFTNFESIATDGALGPLGGDRRVEELARALHLTAAEEAELEALGPIGGPGGRGDLWIQPIDGGSALEADTLYFATDPPSDWMLPLLSASDLAAP